MTGHLGTVPVVITRLWSSRAASITAVVVLLGFTGVAVRQLLGRAYRQVGNDLTAYLLSAQALLDGSDPYHIAVPQGYLPYPLTLATVLIPFVWLPHWMAQILWFIVNAGVLVVALAVTERLWRAAEPGPAGRHRIPFLIRFTALVLVLEVSLQSHLTLGQVNLVVLGLLCLFLRAHVAGRRGAASVWLSAAMATKLTPLVLLVSLGRERRYRTMLLTVGAFLVWTIVLPQVVSTRVLWIYRDAWLGSVGQYVTEAVAFGRATRFTLAAALAYVWPGVTAVPGYRLLAAAVVLAPILWLQGRLGSRVRPRLLVFGLYLLATLLISPLSETHHLVALAVPLWLWSLAAADSRPSWKLDGVGAAVFVVCHWVAVWNRVSLMDFLAIVALYVVLFIRALRPDFGRAPSHPLADDVPGGAHA